MAYQVAAGRNLAAGHGYTFLGATAGDVSLTQNIPLAGWPVGYSAAIAGVFLVTGNMWASILVVDGFSVLILLLAWLAILGAMQVEKKVYLLFFLGLSLFASPVSSTFSAGLMALALFSAGVAILVCGRTHVSAVVASGLLFGACAWVRNAYWPLVVTGAAVLFLLGGQKRIRLSLLNLGTAGVVLLSCVLFQKTQTAHASYLDRKERAPDLQVEYLARVYPFSAMALGFDRGLKRWGSEFGWRTTREYLPESPFWYRVGCWFGALVLLLASALGWAKGGRSGQGRWVLLCGCIAILLTLAMLATLSLVYEPERSTLVRSWEWVFLQSRRYYAVTIPFVLLGVVLFMVGYGRRNWVWVPLSLVLAVCSIEPMWWVYSGAQALEDKRNYSPMPSLSASFWRPALEVKKLHPDTVYMEDAASVGHFRAQAAALGFPVVASRWFRGYRTSQPIHVIGGIPDRDLERFLGRFTEICASSPVRLTPVGHRLRWSLFHCRMEPETVRVSRLGW